MSARDDFGSSAGRGPGAGGLGNGGIGGGMGGGSRGGGAGYNGGAGSRTGLTTGTTTYGNTAFGRPGGNAVAYGMRDAASLGRAGMGPTVGSYGNFRTPSGAAMFGNSPVQGQSFRGMNMGQALSQANRAQARQPASVPGLLGGSPVAAGASAASYPSVEQEMALPTNPPSFMNNPFVDKPATLADYVRSVVKSYQGLNPAPAAPAEAWTPASPTNPPMKSIPGWTNMQRGFGLNWTNNNDSNNWPRQGTPGTRSSGSSEGGYPSLGSQDTRPAGLY
jgi:hypothetical protein